MEVSSLEFQSYEQQVFCKQDSCSSTLLDITGNGLYIYTQDTHTHTWGQQVILHAAGNTFISQRRFK